MCENDVETEHMPKGNDVETEHMPMTNTSAANRFVNIESESWTDENERDDNDNVQDDNDNQKLNATTKPLQQSQQRKTASEPTQLLRNKKLQTERTLKEHGKNNGRTLKEQRKNTERTTKEH